MDLESLGSGAGAGFFTSILIALGWNRRINRLEDNKQDIKVCEERWKTITDMKDNIEYIRKRIDRICNNRDG